MAIAKSVKDILDSRREFTALVEEEDISFFIAQPTAAVIRKADWQYAKIFNQAIVDGFLTQAEMVDVLKDKGIISDDYAKRVEETRIGLASELFKLENLTDEAPELEREGLALEISRLRDDLFTLNQQVNGPMGNTCENLADDARNEYLTSRIVQNKDGSNLWENFEDYQDEENSALSIKSRFEVMLWIQGLESNFLENTPEQEALRNIAQERLTRAIADLREDDEGDPEEDKKEEVLSVDEVEVPAKKTKKAVKSTPKKRGRPKKKKDKPETDPIEETPKDT